MTDINVYYNNNVFRLYKVFMKSLKTKKNNVGKF